MKDQLSALIDGEYDIHGAEHLLTAAKSTGEISQCWAQYHLIGDVIRGESKMHPNFHSRVMQALENEPAYEEVAIEPGMSPTMLQTKPAVSRKVLLKSMPIWSVAASVAAVMFVGWMVLQQNVATTELAPVEIAQNMPMEYLQAHHDAVPSSAAYYMQNVAYAELAHK